MKDTWQGLQKMRTLLEAHKKFNDTHFGPHYFTPKKSRRGTFSGFHLKGEIQVSDDIEREIKDTLNMIRTKIKQNREELGKMPRPQAAVRRDTSERFIERMMSDHKGSLDVEITWANSVSDWGFFITKRGFSARGGTAHVTISPILAHVAARLWNQLIQAKWNTDHGVILGARRLETNANGTEFYKVLIGKVGKISDEAVKTKWVYIGTFEQLKIVSFEPKIRECRAWLHTQMTTGTIRAMNID